MRLRATICAFLAVVCVGAALVAMAVARSDRVASGGDPYKVSSQRLRRELALTGVKIRYLYPRSEPAHAVVGIARQGPAVIGFEFQLFPSSDEATVFDLGKLRAVDFGWPRQYRGVLLEHRTRGVLANVAFEEYEKLVLESHDRSSHNAAMADQLAAQRVHRALDNALFNSFPARDPYARALSATP